MAAGEGMNSISGGPPPGSIPGKIATGSALAMFGGLVGSIKERWDASGGNELVSNVSQQIPQGTKDYISQAKSQVFSTAKLRSLQVFFGLGEEKPFYVESTVSLLIPRIQHNFTFFYLNYMVMTAIFFVLTLVISPSAIIGIALLGAAWMYVLRVTAEGFVTVKGITISQKHAMIGMGIFSAFFLFWLLSHIFWWTLSTSGIVVALHAIFRDASMHKDEEDFVEMSGDLSLEEDAAFLNPADIENPK